AFEKAVLRNGASALGISPQQLSQDWSDVNYSSARASMLEAWKTMSRRREDFAKGFSTPMWAAFLEECMSYGELPLPENAPAFEEMRTAYAGCRWLGPPRGWVDPVAEKKGAVLGMVNGLSTLEYECADQGQDYRETLDQQMIEKKERENRGLAVPEHLQDNPLDLRTSQEQGQD
ncbi:MAG: phage portal protein, partial [Bdellovibrionales bacterium]